MSIDLVKQLRARTQAPLGECKKALEEAGGDLEKAAKILRARGQATAAAKAERTASQGIVESYVHGNGIIGVLIELKCETDFVARSPQFKVLAHDLALHIAAAAPRYRSKEEIPKEILEEEKRIIVAEFAKTGKQPEILDKIAEGKMNALAKEIVFLEQPFVKDPDRTVGEVLAEAIGKFGENIFIGRFVRIAIGEE